MKQLTVRDLKAILERVDDDVPVALGNDEELNGYHGCYFAEPLLKEELAYLCGNSEFKQDKVFLLS